MRVALCLLALAVNSVLAREYGGEVVTEHFVFEYDGVPQYDVLANRAEGVLTYVSQRMGVVLERRIPVSVQWAPLNRGSCVARAFVALNEETGRVERMTLLVKPQTSPSQLIGIFAHEVGHVLNLDGFAKGVGSQGLGEGLASWAAGRYWSRLFKTSSLAESVAAFVAENRFIPLENVARLEGVFGPESDPRECLERRDILYTEWGRHLSNTSSGATA